MSLPDALSLAHDTGLDLVQASANTDEIPVCKLLDYNKYVYRQAKQLRKQRASQRKTEIKGIRIGFSTAAHDMDVKAKKAREFLANGHHVKLMLMFKGREITHFELGSEKVHKFMEMLADIGKPESGVQKQGKTISVLIKPIQNSKKIYRQNTNLKTDEAEDTQRDQETSHGDRQEKA